MNFAVLFKTHFWDEDVARQYERLCENCRWGHVYVLIDRKNGKLDIPEHVKTVYVGGIELSQYGLPDIGGFWFNGDYQTIVFYLQNPLYDFYVSLEYDVATFNNIDTIVEDMYKNKIDSIYENINIPLSRWPHTFTGIDYYNFRDIKKGLFCISFFSRRAMSALYQRRLYLAAMHEKAGYDTWPIGELVMASEVGLSSLKAVPLIDYCSNLDDYEWNRGCTEDYIRHINPRNTFVHPVSNNKKCVASNTTDDVNRVDSKLLLKASFVKSLEFYAKLYSLRKNTEEDRERVYREAVENLQDVPSAAFLYEPNISHGKSAFQSSAQRHYSMSANDAERALALLPGGRFSFHTNDEEHPWWYVDLGSEIFIKKIYIFDREDIDRSRTLGVACGNDLDELRTIFKNDGTTYIGGIQWGGLILELNAVARYVKIFLTKPGMLHLDSVIITGEADDTPQPIEQDFAEFYAES